MEGGTKRKVAGRRRTERGREEDFGEVDHFLCTAVIIVCEIDA